MNELIQRVDESAEAPAPEGTEQQTQSTQSETPSEGQTEGQVEGQESGSGQEQPSYDLESFNKYFGSTFEDESSLRSTLESSSKLSDYESKLSSMEEDLKAAKERASKYDEFIDYFDPKNLYGDEQTWKMVELRKKFPDKDPAVVQQIVDDSFNSLSDINKLILADKLSIPGNISDEVRMHGILRKLGIEADDLSDLTDLDRYTISSAVADKRELFNEIRNFNPEGMKFDLVAEKEARDKEKQSQRTELQNKWKPIADSLLNNYKEAKAYTTNEYGERVPIFKFVADDKFKQEFTEPFMATILNSGMSPTKENTQMIADYLDQQFKLKYWDQIISEAIKQGKTEAAEVTHKEIHNDKAQNTGEAPPQETAGQGMTLREWAKLRKSKM